MASTFSPSLRIELIGDGDQSGIWGQTTNNNLGALIEQAIAGVITITMVDANYTLTNFNGVTDESRNQVIVLTGTNTAQRNLIAPLVEKTYSVKNTTTGGFAVQIIGASGTGVIIPSGQTISVYCDGTNFLPLNTGAAGNFLVSGNLAVTGTTTLTGALNGSTAALSGAISGTTITGTNFIGPGTGLTGTASALSIGGNAATATNATNATNATRITNAGGWSVTPTGTKLIFNYNGTNVGSLDSSGNFIVIGNVTAYGTP
jgi:hypothetical protein